MEVQGERGARAAPTASPPRLLLLLAGAAAPAPDVPGQGSPYVAAVRELALAVCRGGDRLAVARQEQAAALAAALVN